MAENVIQIKNGIKITVLTVCSYHATYGFRVNPHFVVAWMSTPCSTEARYLKFK